MTDAVSTIALGVDTGTGKEDIKSLRAEFAALKTEIRELNELRANTSGLTGGASAAKNELATLTAELSKAAGRINELENQLKSLSRVQVDAAKAATAAVKSSVEQQAQAVINSEKKAAEETQRLARQTTEVVKQEAAKRYTMGQSAKVGSVSYSMRDGTTEADFKKAVTESERVRREVMSNSQTMLIAEVERAEARRREVLANSQAMIIAEAERAEARRREVMANSQAMLIAETDRAEAIRREKAATAQTMLIAEVERAEAKKREVMEMTRVMQMAEIDRAEAIRREKNATAQAMLIAEIDRAEAQKLEVIRNARAMQMAEIDRADALRLEKQRVANDQMIAEAKRAEEQRQLILNSNFQAAPISSKVSTVRKAASLHGDGSDQQRVQLATSLYGSEAISNISNLTQLEAQLTQTRQRGHAATARSTDLIRMNSEAMKDAHSYVRGLAGGLDALWVTWGSVVPLVAGAAITTSMVKMLEAGKDVEYQLQFLRALASDGEKSSFNLDGFLKITDGTLASVKDAAGGMRALAQAGLVQRDAFRALPDVLDLATIGEMNVGQAALTATGVMNAFSLKVQDIGHIGDVFAQVAASSNTSVVGMTESMKQASTVGEMFHVSLEETAASIGVLAQRNIMGTAAGTSLTNALKNLYEPTEKAKAALKALNLTTDDGHGGMKNYTQLLGELRDALSKLDDSSKAVILGTITDQRGAKTLSAITSSFEKYEEFLRKAKDSGDFMSKGVLELEDTVEGSFKRMSNAMEGSLLKAFEDAKPSVRELQTELTHLAKSEDVVSMLTHIAMAGVNITKAFIDHAKAIAVAAGAYMGFKVVTGLAEAFAVWRTSIAASTAALATNTAAAGANAVALEAEAAAAAIAATSATRFATGMRMVAASLGPISLIAMAAYTAYELLSSSVDKSDNSYKRSMNTTDTILDYYDRQISKLRELNSQMFENSRVAEQTANDTAKALLSAEASQTQSKVNVLRAKVAKGPQFSDGLAASMTDTFSATSGQTQDEKDLAAAEAKLNLISDKLLELQNKETELKAARGLNKKLNDKSKVRNELDDLIDASGLGLKQGGTAASKALGQELVELKKSMDTDTEAYKKIAPLLDGYRQKINDAKVHMTLPNKHEQNDLYREAQANLDGKLQAIRDNEKSQQADIKSKLATGEIGDLQAIAQNLEVVKKARQGELAVYKEKESLARGADKKAAAQQVKNKEDQNERADKEADKDADRQRREMFSKWQQDNVKSEAETYTKKGDLLNAYLAQYEAKYGETIDKIEHDLADPKTTLFEALKLNQRKDYLTNQFDAGADSAKFEQYKGQYEAKMAEMQERLAEASDRSARQSSRSPGFASEVGAAQVGDEIRAEAIPALNDLISKMQELADKSGDNKLKSSVSKMGTDLVKEANKSRDAWVAAGKSIETSLTNSFGKSGRAAGGMIAALMKQRDTQKDINDDLKKGQSRTDDPVKQLELENKARRESAELQLSTFADMTGAAKGFFDEQSKGYKALQAAEQVFRMAELAMAAEAFIRKTFFANAEVATVVAGEGEKAAATVAGASVSISASMAEGSASAVAGVANQAKGDPYSAWYRMAAMAAAMAALGFIVGGVGGSGPKVDVAKERQKYTGTGLTYKEGGNNPYDWELQKSDSLTKSMEKLKDNSDIALSYSSSQLNALQKISDGISGLTNSIVQTTGIRGTRADETALGVGSSRSFLGFSGSSTSLTDSGIQFSNSNIANILAGGLKAQSYADTHSESKSWFGLSRSSSDKTTYGNLDGDLLQQMGAIVKSMYTSISDAAKYLGQGNDTLQAALDSVSLSDAGLDKLSLKGLSSSEVESQLNAAFSKLGDVMAKKAMPGLEGFQQATESYLTTLVRVSSGIDQAEYSLQKLGVASVKYTDILNKQGDVATEIVRESLKVKESSNGVSTGIGKIVDTFNGSVTDLADTYTKLNTIRKTMTATGASKADVTSDMVRGAGGLESLSSGVSDFLDNFFTDAEKASAKASMLSDTFASLGVTMPKTREGFKDMVLGIDRTTVSGQKLYGAMVSLSGQFNELADDAGKVDPALTKQGAMVSSLVEVAKRWLDVINSSKGLIDDINDALSESGKVDRTERIKELRGVLNSGVGTFEQQLEIAGQLKDLVLEKYQTEKENAQDLIKFGRDLSKYVTELKSGDLSPLTNKGKLDNALADYQATLTNTNSTDKDVRDEARSQIQDKASTLLDLAHEYYASSQSYTDIFNSVTKDLDKLGASALNDGQAMKKLSEDQLAELTNLKDLVGKIQKSAEGEYSSTVNQLVTQIQILGKMDGSLSMLVSLFAGMPAQIAASLAAKGTTAPSTVSVNKTAKDQIKEMYQEILHRQADEGGLAFFLNNYQSGKATMDDIRSALKNSTEAKNLLINGSHASGLDYVPFDGYVAELHRGERVLTATEARRTDKAAMASTASFSSEERAQMAAEIAELRKAQERTIEAVQQAAQAMVRAMGATSDDNAEKIVKGTKDALSSSDFDSKNKPVFQ